MSIQTNKKVLLLRLRRIHLLPWDTYSWVICFCCFCRLSFKNVLQLVGIAIIIHYWMIFGVRVYIDVFHDIIFSYSLTDTRTLTFGYIKWTPDVAFTGSFLDIVFDQCFRQKNGPKIATKNSEWVCHRIFLLVNLAHGVISVSWKMRCWSVKSRYL